MVANGSAEAIKIRSRVISYEELVHKAKQVAHTLLNNGAQNETIGIVGQRSPSSYIATLGILLAGCNFTPINHKLTSTRIESVIKAANVKYFVGDIDDFLALELVSKNEGNRKYVVVEDEVTLGLGSKFIACNTVNTAFDEILHNSSDMEKLAYILFTSGSTGTPKGVKVTHKNIFSFIKNMAQIYPLDPGFRASQTFDLSFDPAISDIFFTWFKCGTLCVLPEKEIMLPADFIVRERITFWNSIPSIAHFMIKTGNLKPGLFPELTHSMFCGEQFPQHVADAWQIAAPNSSVENLYGPTEATIYITNFKYKAAAQTTRFKNGIIPIGSVFPNHKVALIDNKLQRVKSGDVGEIVFSGSQITNGYINDKNKTESSFVRFNWDNNKTLWYRTGDLGFFNVDGQLECIGRIDSQIKLAGRRIELGEIESVLSNFSHTRGAVVVPLRDDAKVAIGCVAFILGNVDQDKVKRIRDDSKKFLDRVFFPRQIHSIEEFPKTQSGKIDRGALERIANEYHAMNKVGK